MSAAVAERPGLPKRREARVRAAGPRAARGLRFAEREPPCGPPAPPRSAAVRSASACGRPDDPTARGSDGLHVRRRVHRARPREGACHPSAARAPASARARIRGDLLQTSPSPTQPAASSGEIPPFTAPIRQVREPEPVAPAPAPAVAGPAASRSRRRADRAVRVPRPPVSRGRRARSRAGAGRGAAARRGAPRSAPPPAPEAPPAPLVTETLASRLRAPGLRRRRTRDLPDTRRDRGGRGAGPGAPGQGGRAAGGRAARTGRTSGASRAASRSASRRPRTTSMRSSGPSSSPRRASAPRP